METSIKVPVRTLILFSLVFCSVPGVAGAEEPGAIAGSNPQPVRAWTWGSGRSTEARFLKTAGSIVVLERADGRRITVSRSALSAKDIAYLDKIGAGHLSELPPGEGKAEEKQGTEVGPKSIGDLPATLTEGLVLYYDFDKDEGDKVTDLSGKGNHGRVFGAKWTKNGVGARQTARGWVGGACEFDGEGDYVALTRTVQDSLTICAWINTTAAGGNAHHWGSMPICDSEVPFRVTADFGFGINPAGRLVFGEGGSGRDVTITGKARVNRGTWVHACVARDGKTGEIEIFVNGERDVRGIGSTATLKANLEVRIGYGFDLAKYWNGVIDEVMIWNRALSETEIEQLHRLQGGR